MTGKTRRKTDRKKNLAFGGSESQIDSTKRRGWSRVEPGPPLNLLMIQIDQSPRGRSWWSRSKSEGRPGGTPSIDATIPENCVKRIEIVRSTAVTPTFLIGDGNEGTRCIASVPR